MTAHTDECECGPCMIAWDDRRRRDALLDAFLASLVPCPSCDGKKRPEQQICNQCFREQNPTPEERRIELLESANCGAAFDKGVLLGMLVDPLRRFDRRADCTLRLNCSTKSGLCDECTRVLFAALRAAIALENYPEDE